MFDRWLELWAQVSAAQLAPATAIALQFKAGRIAESLKLALWFRTPPSHFILERVTVRTPGVFQNGQFQAARR